MARNVPNTWPLAWQSFNGLHHIFFFHLAPNSFQAGRVAYGGPREKLWEINLQRWTFKMMYVLICKYIIPDILKVFKWVVRAIQRRSSNVKINLLVVYINDLEIIYGRPLHGPLKLTFILPLRKRREVLYFNGSLFRLKRNNQKFIFSKR